MLGEDVTEELREYGMDVSAVGLELELRVDAELVLIVGF